MKGQSWAVKICVSMHALIALLNSMVTALAAALEGGLARLGDMDEATVIFRVASALLSGAVVYTYLSSDKARPLRILLWLTLIPYFAVPLGGAFVLGKPLPINAEIATYLVTSLLTAYALGVIAVRINSKQRR